jgi:hypothetical protein
MSSEDEDWDWQLAKRRRLRPSSSDPGGKKTSHLWNSERPKSQQVSIHVIEEGSAAESQALDGVFGPLARWIVRSAQGTVVSDPSNSADATPNPLDVAPRAKVGSKGR